MDDRIEMIARRHFTFSRDSDGWCIECYDVRTGHNMDELTLSVRLTLNRRGEERQEIVGLNIHKNLISEMQNRLAGHLWEEALAEGLWFTHFQADSRLPLYEYLRRSLAIDMPKNFLRKMNEAQSMEQIVRIVSGRLSCRSVHRAVYESIRSQLQTQGWYDPIADMAICRSFEDPNLAVRFVKLPIKKALFAHLHDIGHAIYFFKRLQKLHHPSKIVRSLETTPDYIGRFYSPKWVDIMRMADELLHIDAGIVKKRMRKTRMQANRLHEELIRCRQYLRIEKNDLKVFRYDRWEKSLQGRYEELEFRLPRSNLEVREWSDILYNCLYGYENVIVEKTSLIVGVFLAKKLTYALEICDGEICQAYGKYNEPIEEEILVKIYE